MADKKSKLLSKDPEVTESEVSSDNDQGGANQAPQEQIITFREENEESKVPRKE